MKKKFKLNMDLASHKAGEEISLECDKNGIPLDKWWRRRLRDAVLDNCMEKVKRTTKKRSDDA